MTEQSLATGALHRFLHAAQQCLPSRYADQEQNRLMLLYFIIAANDLTKNLPNEKDSKEIIDWIYSLQVLPDKNDPSIK